MVSARSAVSSSGVTFSSSGGMSIPSFDLARLARILLIITLAWGGPASALALGRIMRLPGGSAVALAFFGGAAAVVLALWTTRVRRKKPPRRAAAVDGESSWEQLADPRDHYANRWAMYESVSEWLGSRDWKGRSVAEFGHTNDVLRAFTDGAVYLLLEYPEHDVQRLDRVPSDQFDLAILDQTLEHVPDPERALAEVRRVLKPGGTAIVTTPFLVPLHGTKDYGDYTRWAPQGMETLLRRCGFDAQVYSWGNLPAARELLGSMYLTAADARAKRIGVGHADSDAPFPVTVWAIATAVK